MNTILLSELNIGKNVDDKKNISPKSDSIPVSSTEKLVREEVKKLSENAEEIRKLKEQIDSKKKNEQNQDK